MPDSNWQKLSLVEGLKTAIVDNILLRLFLLNKMFLLMNSCLQKFLSSCNEMQ